MKQVKWIHDDPEGRIKVTTVMVPDYLAERPDLEEAAQEIELLRLGAVNPAKVEGELPPRKDRDFWKRNGNRVVVDQAAKSAAAAKITEGGTE